jgi:citrate synthase
MSEKMETLMKARKGIDMNVDFYSASTYYSMGIKPDLFTTVFAISRVSGWTAHVLEQYANNRLIRPRANWIGSDAREVVAMDKR